MPVHAEPRRETRPLEGLRGLAVADGDRQVLDLFRHIAAFRASYDAALLERAAAYAAALVGPALADDLMAAAVRLDNEMRCQTSLDYAPLPAGSLDRHECEEAFLGMLRAACQGSERVALGLAGRFGITETRSLFASAREVAEIVGWPPRSAVREATTTPQRPRWSLATLAYGQA